MNHISQITTRQKRKKPAARSVTSTPKLLFGIDGRPCQDPDKPVAPWMHFISKDGGRVTYSTAALKRAGICPHCCIDALTGARFVTPLTENFFQCIERGEDSENTIYRIAQWLLTQSIPANLPPAMLSDWGAA